MEEEKKIAKAKNIVEDIKNSLNHILWNESKNTYNNSRYLIPWLQEEAEYAIKKLKLNKEKEFFFLKLIQRAVGEYTDDI